MGPVGPVGPVGAILKGKNQNILRNEDIDKVTTKETVTVQKQDGKWKIVVDQNLRNAIFPGLTEAIDSIAS